MAAPLAVVGYMPVGPGYGVPSADIPRPPDGLYQFRFTVASADPCAPQVIEKRNLVAFALRNAPDPAWPKNAFIVDRHQFTYGDSADIPVLLAGVDPEAESALVGLDKTVSTGRYLTGSEPITWKGAPLLKWPVIPVLINLHAFRSVTHSVAFEELNPEARFTDELKDEVPRPLLGKAGPIRYHTMSSPYPQRWPAAVAIEPQAADINAGSK